MPRGTQAAVFENAAQAACGAQRIESCRAGPAAEAAANHATMFSFLWKSENGSFLLRQKERTGVRKRSPRRGVFRAPARVTFSPLKKSPKRRLNLRFKAPSVNREDFLRRLTGPARLC